MKVKNKSNKPIGFGEVTILPDETKEIPSAYENSPVLEVYRRLGFVDIQNGKKSKDKTEEQMAAEESTVNVEENKKKN